MAKVAILQTSPEKILEDIEKIFHLAEIDKHLDKSKPVILKDNISWHLPMPSANTTPWQLEGTIRALQKRGFRDLVAVENKTVVTRADKGLRSNKLEQLYRKYNIPIRYNFKKDMQWVEYTPKSTLKILPKIYPKGLKVPEFFLGKNIVHLPTMKCHIYTTTTGAMKNAFGGLLTTKRHYTHTWIHETLVDLLKIQKEIHPGIFAVMDGTTAGNGPGPRTLRPMEANHILASGDQVAIDAVSAWLMGFDPMSIPYIRMAVEEGLGVGEIEKIDIVGDAFDRPLFQFTVGDNLASLVGDFLWFGPLKRIQWLFFHTPLVYMFVLASDWYHDRVWWTIKGKQIYQKWLCESPWGQLFQHYGG